MHTTFPMSLPPPVPVALIRLCHWCHDFSSFRHISSQELAARWTFWDVTSLDLHGSPLMACVKWGGGFPSVSACACCRNWLAFCSQNFVGPEQSPSDSWLSRCMRVPYGMFKAGFWVFMVMSTGSWGSVKQCLISREQCLTAFLPYVLSPF